MRQRGRRGRQRTKRENRREYRGGNIGKERNGKGEISDRCCRRERDETLYFSYLQTF